MRRITRHHFPVPGPPEHELREHASFTNLTNLRDKRTQPPQTILRSATSGTIRDYWKKTTTTIKIGFYFFTYECCRRRLPLIKMIHGVEEVVVLLFTAFRYEYLFWSEVVRAWIVRLFIREKILFVEKTNDKKKEDGKPKKNIWREKCFNKSI